MKLSNSSTLKQPLHKGITAIMQFIDLRLFCMFCPYAMVVSEKSYIEQIDLIVGWAPRAHQTLGAATMVGRGLPTLRTATTL